MNWFIKIAQERILSRPEFEDMVQRVYNRYREPLEEYGFKTWREWLNNDTPYNMSLTIESEHDIYDRYLRDLPEEIRAIDLINMYKLNELPLSSKITRDFSQIPIEPTFSEEPSLPWQKKKAKDISQDEAIVIYDTASQRMTKTNREQVLEARKELYFAFNSDKDLPKKLGIKPSELVKRIRQYSGLTSKSIQLEESFNRGVPEEHQWVGITNTSFIGRQSVDHNELESLVKYITVSRGSSDEYKKQEGEILRNYIARTFLAIDTKIDYSDLGFDINNIEKKTTKGEFKSQENKIVIDQMSPNTVAHEIGHYLDYKWARQYDDNISPLSTSSRTIKEFPKEHQTWIIKFKNFVQNLVDKSDIGSEYTQRPSEVFARFIDKFTRWTSGEKNHGYYIDRNDRFSESDYRLFVRILQEKSYIDAAFPILQKV